MQLKMPRAYITVINNSMENLKVIVIYHCYTCNNIRSIARNFSDINNIFGTLGTHLLNYRYHRIVAKT